MTKEIIDQRDRGHEALCGNLRNLLALAEGKEFHDFENTEYAAPKMKLIQMLQEMIDETKEGLYDN